MNCEQLRFCIKTFEDKINEIEKNYKDKHKEDFDKQKMNKYINRKLQKQINGLICLNLAPSVNILN